MEVVAVCPLLLDDYHIRIHVICNYRHYDQESYCASTRKQMLCQSSEQKLFLSRSQEKFCNHKKIVVGQILSTVFLHVGSFLCSEISKQEKCLFSFSANAPYIGLYQRQYVTN